MTANEFVSAPVPAVVGTATTGRPGARSGPSYSSSQTGRSLLARRSSALAASIDEPPPTGTTTVSSSPNSRSAAAPRSTVEAPGFGSTSSNTADSRPAAARTARTSSMTPEPWTPGSVTTKTREPPAAATTSGSRPIAPTPKWTRLRRTISICRSARRVIDMTSTTVSVDVSRRTVSQRRQPAEWNQRSVVTPSGFSKTHTSSKSRSSGSVSQSGTARRSPPKVNSSIGRRPQRGQVSHSISGSPPSPGRPGRGHVGSGRARTARSAPAGGPWRSARPSPRHPPGWP